MTNKALSKKRIDEVQETLEAMAMVMESLVRVSQHPSGIFIEWHDENEQRVTVKGISLHDAYINALHAQVGTEPPPF